MTRELISQFEEADKIMRGKFGKEKGFARVNGNHPKYGFIVKKAFNYIVGNMAWKIDRIVTTPENKEHIETRLSNVLRHFAHRWSINVKSIKIKSYRSDALSLKNAIRTIMIDAEDAKRAERKIKAIDDMVIDIIKGRVNALHILDSTKSKNPYKCADFI